MKKKEILIIFTNLKLKFYILMNRLFKLIF